MFAEADRASPHGLQSREASWRRWGMVALEERVVFRWGVLGAELCHCPPSQIHVLKS